MQLNDDEKKYKVRRDNNCGIIFIVSLVSIIILCSILTTSLLKQHFFPYDFPGTIDSWISASASIAGGALAFGGVWWTIKDQNKKRKEDLEKRDREKKEELAIQYRPLLECINNNDVKFQPQIKDNILFGYLFIHNVGRGEAINIHVSSISDSVLFYETNNTKCTGKNASISYLPIKNETAFPFKYVGVLPEVNKTIKLQFHLKYTDLYDHYILENEAFLLIKREGNIVCKDFIRNDSLSAKHRKNN